MENILEYLEKNKENFLNNFNDYFVNNPPTKCFVDLNKVKKGFDLISNTAKAGRILNTFALSCIPLSFALGCFDERILACLGIACFASMGAGISLSLYSKRKYDKFIEDNVSMDFINYSIYKQNEKLKNLINITESNKERQILIKNNLISLLETQDSIVDNLKASEIIFENMYEIYEGNLNDIIKKRDFELTKIFNSYDYVSKHITENYLLYSCFAPEYQQSINDSYILTENVDKIKDEFMSANYIDKRRNVECYVPIKKNFEVIIEQ